jgi:ABC-type oligopeptide transport system ATPase subunit
MIIGINGYSGSGKDTIGAIIQYLKCSNVGNNSIEEICKNYQEHEEWLENESDWVIRKFAGKLKDIASHLTGIDIEDFENQEFKKTNLGTEWWTTCDEGHQPMTVRDFLQKLGTDALRNNLHDNVWVNALMADYDEEYSNWIITDTRFPNEAMAIKNKGGIILRVERPGVSPINDHPSETGLDHWKFDYRIVNNSDMFDLKESVKNILMHANLL